VLPVLWRRTGDQANKISDFAMLGHDALEALAVRQGAGGDDDPVGTEAGDATAHSHRGWYWKVAFQSLLSLECHLASALR